MLIKSAKQEQQLIKLVTQGFYATYFLFFKSRRLEVNDLMIANPDLNLALELWNMLENKFIMQAFELSLPAIRINKKIFIPMVDTIITRENVHILPIFENLRKTITGRRVLNNELMKERLNLELEEELEFEDVKSEIDFHLTAEKYNPK